MTAEKENELLNQAKQIINATNGQISVEELGNQLKILPRIVNRIFWALEGQSAANYIKKVRIQTALSVIAVSNESVRQIAARFGLTVDDIASAIVTQNSALSEGNALVRK